MLLEKISSIQKQCACLQSKAFFLKEGIRITDATMAVICAVVMPRHLKIAGTVESSDTFTFQIELSEGVQRMRQTSTVEWTLKQNKKTSLLDSMLLVVTCDTHYMFSTGELSSETVSFSFVELLDKSCFSCYILQERRQEHRLLRCKHSRT